LQYVERKPNAALADFVECFWVVRDRPRRIRTPDRILPDGCPEWIVHVGDEFERQIAGRWVRQPKSFLAGTLSHPWLVRAGRRVCTLGIRFRPGTVALLFNMDLAGTANREINLRTVLRGNAASLARAVRDCRTTQQMLTVAEQELLNLVAPRLHNKPRSHAAVKRILVSKGKTRIETMARSLGLSRRTLERVFRRELGISPKHYARIVRLNSVLATMNAAERERIVTIALDAGYFDESHLLRDFRSLAGRNLSGRESDGKLARHFTSVERLRVLLGGEP